MPIIKNYCNNATIEFELNLHAGEGFIYNESQPDYLNWIPYDFRLTVGKDNYTLKGMSFSVEGLKCFLAKLHAVVNERNETKVYKKYSYCGPENEFEIKLENTEDHFKDLIVLTELWINAACLPEPSSGYSIGFNFIIKYEDLKIFLNALQVQLNVILNNH